MGRLRDERHLAAQTAADRLEPGAVCGLGTGATVAELISILGCRDHATPIVPSSPSTAQLARDAGLTVLAHDSDVRVDVAIDGADQIAPDGWVVKGRGGAQTRERAIIVRASRVVVIASADKLVGALRPPIPLELSAADSDAILRELPEAHLRDWPPTPDGGVLADYRAAVEDPAALAARLDRIDGIVGHGLFAPELIDDVIVARGSAVKIRSADAPHRTASS